MFETVCYTYRLRPGAQARSALLAHWNRCRFLWNEAVHHQRCGHRPTLYSLSKQLTQARGRIPWLREGSQLAQQQTLRTYAQSLGHSLEVKGRGRAKFKAHRKTLPTPEYTLRGFTLRDGRLRLPAGVSRRRRARGQAPSKGCLRARRQAAKLHQKGARQTLHDSGIWAKRGVEHPQVIAVEDFKALFLATFTMARKSADAAIGAATAELIDRGTRAGATVVRVAPAYRAMMCSRCWQRQARLRLARRTFRCARCGFTAGRDRNAAAVTLATAERIRGGVDDVRHVPPPLGLVASAVRARNPQASAAGNR